MCRVDADPDFSLWTMSVDREICVSIEDCEEAVVTSFEDFKLQKRLRLQEAVAMCESAMKVS